MDVLKTISQRAANLGVGSIVNSASTDREYVTKLASALDSIATELGFEEAESEKVAHAEKLALDQEKADKTSAGLDLVRTRLQQIAANKSKKTVDRRVNELLNQLGTESAADQDDDDRVFGGMEFLASLESLTSTDEDHADMVSKNDTTAESVIEDRVDNSSPKASEEVAETPGKEKVDLAKLIRDRLAA